MKTKIKRHSRAVISVILTLCMLMSCMTVGLIATDAAKVTDSDAIGAKDDGEELGANLDEDEDEELGASYFLYYRRDNTKSLGSGMTVVQMTASGSNFTAEFTTNNQNFVLAIGNSSSASSSLVRSSWTLTKDSGIANWTNIQDNSGVYYVCGWASSGTKITVTYNGSNKVTLASTAASSECSTNKTYIVTGDNAITGTTGWSNTSTQNKLTYNSTLKCYTKTYTVSYTTSYFRWRIVESGSWDTTWGYDRSNEIDQSSICTYEAFGSDNNIKMTLSQKANIEIRFDDSKTDTSAITVIVTPFASTVTAAVSPANTGTATVNNAASASSIEYGGSVTLAATPATNYQFKSWSSTNDKLSFASTTSASTTATVLGTDTATATFEKVSFTVSKGTGGATDANMFTITTPAANQSKQWGTSVSVTAESTSEDYYIDYLYYLNNNTGEEQVISGGKDAGEGTSTNLSGSFSMPTNNVTVYAHTHKRPFYAVNYAVSTDSGSAGHGYVNAGVQYSTSDTNVTKTITSGDTVIQNSKVNIGARAEEGYRFVGWYPNADGSGDVISTAKDVTVTVDAAKNYYAKFESLTASAGVRIYVPYAQRDEKVWIWGTTSPDTGTSGSYDSRPTAAEQGTAVDLNGSTYYMFDYPNSSTVNFRLGNNQDQPKYTTGTYVADDNTVSGNSGVPTFDIFYPVKFAVTNPELAGAETYAPLFGKKSTSTTFYHTPADASNNKMSVTTTGFTSDDTDQKTTSTSRSKTMPSSGATTPVYTVTIIPKDYYKVTFSAGAGGTISATAGGTAITSGTMVQEGKTVVFTATPNSGFSVSGWTGSGDLDNETTSTATSKTVDSLSTNTETRVYFSKSKGTETATTYIGYHIGDSGYDDPNGWTNFSKTYVRNGRVWGYITGLSNNKIVSFNAYDGNSRSTDKQYYYKSDQSDGVVWASTDFSGITPKGNRPANSTTQWRNHYYQNNYIRFKVTDAAIKGVMIDLGPEDSSTAGKARPDLDNNTYKIYPIFNTDISKVTVYAKDGSLRGSSDYDYFPGIADTFITADGTNVTGRMQHSEFETAVATKGQSITVTTTIDANHKDKFYVRGYSVNGVTPALYNYREDGEYTMTYTIPADFEDDYLEITPIYYYKHTDAGTDFADSNMVQFYIENYDAALQAEGWGNTLSVYPYYQNAAGSYVKTKHNAFGGYPGQPVINYGGRRFIEIPIHYKTFTVDNGDEEANNEECFIKGMTLSNDYYDIVHREYCRAVDDHLQTYDYDDFYKIAKETSDNKEVNGRTGTADQITFAFKYRDAKNNFSDSTNNLTTYAEKDTYAGQTVKAPYSEFTAEEKISKFGNGWEPLLDYHDRPVDLFGKQLTTAEQAQDPVLVVSDDYAINYVGCYATTWTVYVWNSTTSKYENKGEIAPSALIVSSADRLDDGEPYPAVKDSDNRPSQIDKKLSSYKTVYQALEAYKGRPVQITYESAIENNSSYEKYWNISGVGSSEVSKRNDGRWFYSYEGEHINANLRIEYKNAGEADTLYVTDSFREGTNKGTVTGATVQFNNTTKSTGGEYPLEGYRDTVDYNEDYPANPILSNQNDYFNFTATPGSGYIFAGWWFERDGKVTPVNADEITKLTGSSQMTSNATFVARYIKNPSGNLTINHTLKEDEEGSATTYVGVKAIKGSTETWLTGEGGAEGYVEDGYTISDATYTSYNSGYTFRVYLKTVVTNHGYDLFDKFSSAEDESASYFSTENQSTSDNTTITYFDVDSADLFELVDSFPVQQFDTLTYYSELKQQNIHYKLIYSYTSKIGDRTNYGAQKYKTEGIFTREEFNKYLVWDPTMVTQDSTPQTGWFKFNNYAGEFLAKKAPYESNIRNDLKWDFSSSYGTVSHFAKNTANNWTGEITVSKSSTEEAINTKRLQFIFPYRMTNTNDGTEAQKTDGKVIELKSTDSPTDGDYSIYLTKRDQEYGKPYSLNDDDIYVSAEPVIYDKDDNTIPKYFQYWSVKTVPTGVEINNSTSQSDITDTGSYVQHEVARCYNTGFNFSVYEDYIVTPVYASTEGTQQHSTSANITWAENGRNQWNYDKGTAKWGYGDRIFSDFMVTFDRQDKLKLSSVTDKSVNTGIITQKLDTIYDANAGTEDAETWKVQSESFYADKYAGTDSEKTNIQAYIQGREEDKDNNLSAYAGMSYNSTTGKFVLADDDGYENSFITMSSIDNKNRLEFTKGVPNISQSDATNTGRKNYVYRAYAYMIDWNMVNGVPTTIKSIVISDPIYYTIYDIAMIENGSSISNYTPSA